MPISVSLSWSLATVLATTLPAQLVVVRPLPWPTPPPLQRSEWQPPRPSERHVWVGGHFAPEGDRLVWRAGRWTIPPEPRLRYEPARWDDRGGRFVFLRGHFRPISPASPDRPYDPPSLTASTRAPVVPPPAPIEQHDAPPFPGAVWIAGWWWYDGIDFLWVAGRWSAAPTGQTWLPPRWIPETSGARFEPGRWQP